MKTSMRLNLVRALIFFSAIVSEVIVTGCSLSGDAFVTSTTSSNPTPILGATSLKIGPASPVSAESPAVTFDSVPTADYYEARLVRTRDGAFASDWLRVATGGKITGSSVIGGETYSAKLRAVHGLTGTIVAESESAPWRASLGGHASSWGQSVNSGPQGNGFEYHRTYSSQKITVSTKLASVSVSRGETSDPHGGCGLTAPGAAYCWSETTSTVPLAVGGGIVFSSLTNGASFKCGLSPAGVAYCWGANGASQLGDGTTNASALPVLVSGGHVFAEISGGSRFTCGRKSSGAVYCWGDTSAIGNFGGSVPTLLTGGNVFTTISAGDSHACGITTVGFAYCWGGNTYGQMGNSSAGGPQSTPVRVE
ncbi:MAG: hypothetical protein EOP06_06795, partial [Proteobacteria bacterium]